LVYINTLQARRKKGWYIEKGEMGEEYSTDGRDEKYKQFLKTCWKENTWKTYE
jgi:hypothetical protein